MPEQVVTLDFPLGGLSEKLAYGKQDPNTSTACQNVRATDTFHRRWRGGSRPGIEKAFTGQMGSGSPVQTLVSVSLVEDDGTLARVLIACSQGQMYRNNGSAVDAYGVGTLTTETEVVITTEAADEIWLGGMQLNSDLQAIQACERAQKVYLANWGAVQASGTDGTMTNGVLTATGIADWTSLGIGFPSAVTITGTGGDVVTGTYQFLSVAEAGLTIDDGGITSGDCSYSIENGPVVFDPDTGETEILLPTAGQVPMGCPLICLYRDRIVLAGPDHVWYMSRQGTPTDWDYGADSTDPGLAVAGTLSNAGTPGTPIRALIPVSDDYLIFGCEDQLWVLRGDPAYGGQLDNLSRNVGIIGPNAWCRLPGGAVLFLSRSGLYILDAGASSKPGAVSKRLLPNRFIDLDPEANTITMAYDSHHEGIHIAITPVDGSEGEHWWVQKSDASEDPPSFWPVTLPDAIQPTAMLPFAATTDDDFEVILGTHDGYLRRYSDVATDDDGTAFTSYVRYGPTRLAGDDYNQAMVNEVVGTLDTASGEAFWRLYIEETNQQAAGATVVRGRGTWSAGRNRSYHPKRSGGALTIELNSPNQWACESITATLLPRGRQRK